MCGVRPIATDTADFPKLRGKGCIYVDKTMFMHRMVSDVGTSLYFISRPRRFGKSLTVSALKALFSGRRELFKGLAIDKTDWKWETRTGSDPFGGVESGGVAGVML